MKYKVLLLTQIMFMHIHTGLYNTIEEMKVFHLGDFSESNIEKLDRVKNIKITDD